MPPDQSISLTVEVNVPSSVVIGLGSAVLTVVTCHPDPASGFSTTIGCVERELDPQAGDGGRRRLVGDAEGQDGVARPGGTRSTG